MAIQTDRSDRTPQEYELLTGGGAESAELEHKGLSRRQFLRRAVGVTIGIVGVEATAGALYMLYPNLKGQFGSVIPLKNKSLYPGAQQKEFALDEKGMFYESAAKSYIMHLLPGGSTTFLLNGTDLQNGFVAENWVVDSDGSYWLALYQVCVHLGCKVPFRDDCNSFKCPCHGSHYNIDGEYLDGPAPRSLDRFAMSFDKSGVVQVDTGKLNQRVERPDVSTRILNVPGITCSAS
ncbi:MAG TPA: ubiquinol-cytochrome c reductase iron-sulfur subunit [Ktedonobacterales bacterium]|nr:ubiquinol-cytochrome c reductase iron-sulfur subunit [Ktedonobacterales bacterium]